MTLQFVTGGASNYSFVSDPCGGKLNRETGMIRSPRYPKNYPNNCDCKWRISVRKGYIVKLKFWYVSMMYYF